MFSWPRIRRDQNVVVIGPKGSGKTEVLKALLRTRHSALVVDTKRVEDWSMIGDYVDENEVRRIRGGRFIYRVPKRFINDEEMQSALFDALLEAKNRCVAIDELTDIYDSDGFRALAKQGRASRVALWAGTQRPTGVPLYALSEADHFFIFSLLLKRDRERMEEATGGAQIPWAKLAKVEHGFVYFNPGGRVSDVHWLPGPIR